jgi:hypothetical protein
LLTQAAYARRCGYSATYIGKCVMLGLITRKAVTVDERGRKWIDPKQADQDLSDNRGFIANNPSGFARDL